MDGATGAAASSKRRSPGVVLAWSTALILGFALRAAPLTAARPYIAYLDEGGFLYPAMEMIRVRTWDPHQYLYPQFPRIAVAAAGRLLDAGGSLHEAIPDRYEFYDEFEPFEFLLAARVLSLVLGLGILVAAGFLAARLAGPIAGAATALLVAVVPALVLRGSIASIDSWATLAILGCLLSTDVMRTSTRPGLVALAAGALAGLAFASKYPAVMVGLAFATTAILLPISFAERARRLALGAIGLPIGAILGMPALIRHVPEVVGALRLQKTWYSQLSSDPSLWTQAMQRSESGLTYAGPEVGWPLCLMALAGVGIGLRRRATAPTVAGWCVFAAASLAAYGTQTFQPFRNLLPLVPLACAAAAMAFVALRARLRRPALADGIGALAVVLLFGVPMAAYARRRHDLVDPRTAAVDWLASRARPTDAVLYQRELAFLRAEMARVPGTSARANRDAAPERIRDARPRFVVAGVLMRPDRSLDDAAAWPELSDYRPVFHAGGTPTPPFADWWHGNDQIVVVFEREAPR